MPERDIGAYQQAHFELDDSPSVMGYHDPAENWNGFACPVFPLESVRKIKVILDQWFDHAGEGERIEITDDGRVFIYCENERVEKRPIWMDTVDVQQLSLGRYRQPVYSIGSYGWVWTVSCPEHPCQNCGEMVREDEYHGHDQADGTTSYLCENCYGADFAKEWFVHVVNLDYNDHRIAIHRSVIHESALPDLDYSVDEWMIPDGTEKYGTGSHAKCLGDIDDLHANASRVHDLVDRGFIDGTKAHLIFRAEVAK